MSDKSSFLMKLLRSRTAAAAGAVMMAAFAACDNPHEPERPPPVASVEISQTAAELPIGSDQQLSAVLKAADGRILSGRSIAWSSSDSLVATVSTAGRVNAVGRGEATITARSEGKSDSARITVFRPHPVPSISDLSPSAMTVGSPDFILTVTGTGFASGSLVRWNGVERQTTFVSDTELRAQIRTGDIAAVGTVAVQVANPAPGGGHSNAHSFEITTVPGPRPVPTLAELSPGMIVAGSSGGPLTIGGSGFVPESQVRLDGVERPTTYVNPGLLIVTIPAADLAVPRVWQVTVSNPAPGGGISEARRLEVTATLPNPEPVLNGITPGWALAGGADFTLVVRGRNFVSNSSVRWNGLDRPTTYVSDTELRTRIPAADIARADRATVSVFNPAPAGGTSQQLVLPIHGFSDSGSYELIFEGTTLDGRAGLFLARPSMAGAVPGPLHVGIEAMDPTPSPDGSKITFAGVNAGGSRDIYVANRDGSGLRRLTHSDDFDTQPAWSPDGTKIAFSSYRSGGQSEIWVMNADGTNPINLTPTQQGTTFSFQDPTWSPDGSRIVYARGHHGGRHIWSMRASDGGDKRQLTSTSGLDSEPAWSPNGQVIAFTRTATDGSERVLFMRSDGVQMPWATLAGRSPAWSPNGEWIAHSVRASGQGARYEIVATRLDGMANLTITGGQPGGPGGRNPAWIRRP